MSLPEWKQQALEQFQAWLAEVPDTEPSDEMVTPAADLYSLAEELTALKQEMRTLGRSTARLAESSESVSKTVKEELPELLRVVSEKPSAETNQETLQGARRSAERPFLIELGDLYTALSELQNRSLDMKWPFYVSAKVRHQLEQAQSKPLDVLAARLNALLNRHAVKSMVVVGDCFDAKLMNAAGTSADGAVNAGCISAVVQQGFVCGDDVLRQAEVIVEEA